MHFSILKYELLILRDEVEIFSEIITGQKFSNEVKTLLCNLKHLDCIFLKNIKIDFGETTEARPLELLYSEC